MYNRHKCHNALLYSRQLDYEKLSCWWMDIQDELITGTGNVSTTIVKNPLYYKQKVMYLKPPHIIANKFFTTESIMQYIEEKRYGMRAHVQEIIFHWS